MPSQWIYSFGPDLAGKTTEQGITIERLSSRNPPRWAVVCTRCGCRWNEKNETVLRTPCLRGINCRRATEADSRRNDSRLLDKQRELIRNHETAAANARLSAAASRMDAETADYELPSRERQQPELPYRAMSERQRASLVEFEREEQALKSAERERLEAPIRVAEAEIMATHRRLNAVERERLEGRVKDPNVVRDPAFDGVRMSEAQAEAYNLREFEAFRKLRPDVQWNSDLIAAFQSYFTKNGIRLASRVILEALVSRFLDAGLLTASSAEEEQPEDAPVVESAPVATERQSDFIQGIDWETGLAKAFTRRQVDRMSADQYRKCFPVLSSVGELLTAMRKS